MQPNVMNNYEKLLVEMLRRFRESAPVQCNVESAITCNLEWP